jgi:hypothetical protein
MFAVLAQALLAALRARLPGYTAVTPDVIQRRFLETPGQIITDGQTITVRLERRAYSPVLRKASLPAPTQVPWWAGEPCATNTCRRCAEPPAWKSALGRRGVSVSRTCRSPGRLTGRGGRDEAVFT